MPAAYGLIGFPLTHSFSPGYFKNKFAAEDTDAIYTAYPLSSAALFLPWLKEHPQLLGLNVTIPYKEAIIPFLDEMDMAANTIGAVNCITIRNGKTKGYNTDIIGFEQSLTPLLHPHHNKALILGTGGASKAVAYVLEKLGITYMKVSRTEKQGTLPYDALAGETIEQYKLIINTTPAGMYPDIDACPAIPYEGLTRQHLLYDLIYNPAETKFLFLGKGKGASIKNGLEMLQLQADASWKIWNS